MIVSKAVKMAEMMNIPIIGLVENMSYFKCPDSGKDYQIFGESHIEEIAEKQRLREKREAERIQAEEAEQQPTEEIVLEAEDEESPAFTMSM